MIYMWEDNWISIELNNGRRVTGLNELVFVKIALGIVGGVKMFNSTFELGLSCGNHLLSHPNSVRFMEAS